MKPLEKLIKKIDSLKKGNNTLLVAIDGRGGSGKSTLAKILKEKLTNVSIVKLDDFAYPMQGADRQRLLDQVILPLENNAPAHYQRYDWKTKKLAEWHDIRPGGIVIIEGVLVLHDMLRGHYDYKIWIECPAKIGFQRGVARDISQYHVDTTKDWLNTWMPEEKKAIEEQQPRKKADFVIDGTKDLG